MIKMERCSSLKGFLSFIVLKLISKKNMSGQEISQEIKKRKGVKPSPGTIYPVLKNLNQKGFIEEIDYNGKTKRYKLTKKGKKELEAATIQFCQIFYDMQDEFKRCCK